MLQNTFKMADASEDERPSTPHNNDSVILAMLKTINGNLNELKDNDKKQEARMDSLERRVALPPSENAHSQSNDDQNMSDNDDFFQPSQKSLGKADEDLRQDCPHMEFSFEDIISSAKVGEDIDERLAVSLKKALLGVDDREKLAKLIEKNPRPGNLPELVVPTLNKEIKPDNLHINSKENQLCGIQRNITSALSILIEILQDVGKSDDRKLERGDIYAKTNQTISLLASSHKSLTMARKLNVKYTLASGIQHLCTKEHVDNSKRRRNEELFEEDLGNEVETAFRMRRMVQKVAPKNLRGRGRGQFRNPQPRGGRLNSNQFQGNKKRSGSSSRGRGRGRLLGPQH